MYNSSKSGKNDNMLKISNTYPPLITGKPRTAKCITGAFRYRRLLLQGLCINFLNCNFHAIYLHPNITNLWVRFIIIISAFSFIHNLLYLLASSLSKISFLHIAFLLFQHYSLYILFAAFAGFSGTNSGFKGTPIPSVNRFNNLSAGFLVHELRIFRHPNAYYIDNMAHMAYCQYFMRHSICAIISAGFYQEHVNNIPVNQTKGEHL